MHLGLPLSYCSDKWHSFDDYCYFKHDVFPANSGTSWNESRSACLSLGADLSSVTSQAEHQFMMDHFMNNQYYWIGYTDQEHEGKWIWSDGSSAKFTKWRKSTYEPNNKGNEDCACAQKKCPWNGDWNDAPCADKFGYICKRRKGIYIN